MESILAGFPQQINQIIGSTVYKGSPILSYRLLKDTNSQSTSEGLNRLQKYTWKKVEITSTAVLTKAVDNDTNGLYQCDGACQAACCSEDLST
jgi:hypothetical protein